MKCPACGGEIWTAVYEGAVRSGKDEKQWRTVLECRGCSIQMLDKFYESKNYETGQYRADLKEDDWDYEFHDAVQRHVLHELPSMREKVVVEVGCGNGSLLDMIKGCAAKVIGVEPNQQYGYAEYRYVTDLPPVCADYVIAVDVIEHTEDPVQFLKDISSVASKIFIVTPNRNEILFKLLPSYKEFRYQTVHNWYFDRDSLWNCADAAGLTDIKIRTIHRYGIGNTFGWLLENRPVGDKKYEFLNGHIDEVWRSCLNREGLGEALLMECRRRENG